MSERVAVRTSHWHSLSVYHDVESDGTVACRTGDRDIQFRLVDRDQLPDHVDRCANCADDYPEPTSTGPSLATQLRAADDPEEVLGQ